jgi:hypothetical protein
MRRASLALVVVLAVAPGTAVAQPGEPPPEAGEGDYALEVPDSLGEQELELVVGASSRTGSPARRSQRVSFRGGGARGTIREGEAELGTGRIEAPFAGGTLRAGQLAPRWGRGLVLGGAAEPWARSAEDRGARARYRGRSGSGAQYGTGRVSLLAGRFAARDLAGARLAAGPFALGALLARSGRQLSLAGESGGRASELALDARGRWRAEGSAQREVAGARLSLRLRAGLTGFHSLAEPARSGPALTVAASLARRVGAMEAGAFGALWSWRAGAGGARAALEVSTGLGQHGSLALGVLEQQGARREPAPRARPTGTRQGWWCEWRGGPPRSRLSFRHELWGARAFARDAVRRALVARAEWAVARGGRASVLHAAWRARSGESLYLPEAGADRLVLRSLAGAGSRTLAELRLPFAAGEVRLAVTCVTGGTRAAGPPSWAVEWSRRSRLAVRAAGPPREGVHEVRGADEPAHDGRVVRHAGARSGAGGAGPEHRAPGDR